MRRSRKTKFPDMDRRKNARKGKEMGRLRLSPIRVNRWQWADEVVFSTWRDMQDGYFGAIRREMWTKRAIVGGGFIAVGIVVKMILL